MSEFVGIVSHDLRNPIGTLHSTCQLLTKYPEDIPTFIPEMVKTSKRALCLVNDLLDLTAMENGKTKITLEPCNFLDIANSAVKEIKFLSDKKDITVHNNVKDTPNVRVDYHRLFQVLNNLLTNAIKFTHPKGTISINAISKKEGLQIEVIDTGVGISPSLIPELFNKHKKTSTCGTGGEIGTGYGLPLSQEILQTHNSTIKVKSETGKGSTLYFTLPWHIE